MTFDINLMHILTCKMHKYTKKKKKKRNLDINCIYNMRLVNV